jgi:cupin fold WbuC family metalloprotein
MELRKVNDDVYYAVGPIVRLGEREIALVKERAAVSPRKRARICAHRDPADRLHEMLIGLCRGGYVPPHKHAARAESFHVFEGTADVVVFDDAGAVIDVVRLSSDGPAARMYRMNEPRFHTVLVRSPVFVVHETTEGPFDRGTTQFAPWAPGEGDDPARIQAFLDRIEAELSAAWKTE